MKKKRMFPLLAVLVVLAAGALKAQSNPVEATVPFDFTAGDITLPAGEYRVTSLGDAGTLLLAGAKKGLVSTQPVETNAASASTRLVFHRYGSRYFLYQIWVRGNNSGRELPKTRVEREMAGNRPPEAVAIIASR
jgi:hypothetical protein